MYPDMLATATYLPGTEYILVTDGCVKINLLGFTENLLEFSDVIPRHHRDSEHPISVLSGGGSLLLLFMLTGALPVTSSHSEATAAPSSTC